MESGQRWPPDLTKRLPVEILAMIFHAWKGSRSSKKHGLRAEWVRATRVCKRWREVALGIPTLWSSVLVAPRGAHSSALEMQLDRARGTALDLLVSSRRMSKRKVEEALSLVLAKKKSVRKLKIVYDTEQAAVVEAFIKRLYLDNVVDDSSAEAEEPWTRVHRFLEACPNLEALRIVYAFEYPLVQLDPGGGYHDLPVVTLPKLRFLSVEELALDMSTALGTLRLPALSTFHINGNCGSDPYDCDFYIIPQNISDTLPPIRRSRCLSLVVGGAGGLDDLTLQGSPRDTFCDGDGSNWSIALPDLEVTNTGSDFLGYPCCIRYNCRRFLARLPHIVVPSNLVQLRLHVSDGLPVARDWAAFFSAMVHLRRLEIGSGALIRRVVEALEADPGLCPELEDLVLCVCGAGTTSAEEDPDLGRTIGAWVGVRATPLKTLTVLARTDPNADDSVLQPSSDSASNLDVDLPGYGRDTESAGLKLWRDLAATLKPQGVAGEVFLTATSCPACGVVYETVDADEIGHGEEGAAYY
ncbi:hypothetical protein LXA43DRAFT_1102497 [Ganoderma leucocontextum]|nr:hypothetical protein LXA43DRAFT_1102497 [Ganoderma leucocontextum]